LFRQARSCGISAKTLRRAGKALGLKPTKTAFEGPWAWEIGNAECGIRKEEERRAGSSECGAVKTPSDEIDLDVDAYGFRVPHMQVGGVTI